MDRWAKHTGALVPTTWIGCVTWLALMAGVIAWLRASGRGRRGWEPVTLHVRRRPPAGVDVRAELLSPTRPPRNGPGPVRHGMRLPRPLGDGRSALRTGHPLSAVRASGRRALVRDCTGDQEALLCGGGSADRSDPGRPSRGPDVRSRLSGRRAGNRRKQSRSRAGRFSGRRMPTVRRPCCSIGWRLSRSRLRSRGGPRDVSAPALSSPWRSCPSWRSRSACGSSSRRTSTLLFHGPGGDIGVARSDPGVHSPDSGRVVGRVDPVDLPPLPRALRCQHVGGCICRTTSFRSSSGASRCMAILFQLVRGGDRKNLWPWVAVAAVDLFTLSPFQNAFSTGRVVWFWQVVLVVPGIVLAAQPLLVRDPATWCDQITGLRALALLQQPESADGHEARRPGLLVHQVLV